MKIAVDAREITGKPTGVGTYLAHLLGEWQAMPAARQHRWTLYAPGETGSGGVFDKKHLKTLFCEWRVVPGGAGTLWEQVAFAAAIGRDRPDVLFAPGYTAPLAVRVPIVLTIHDVSFFAHPEWFGRREGLRRRIITRRAARKARRILTVSRFSKDEIVSRIGVPADRVEVILHGITRPPAAWAPRLVTPNEDGYDSRPPTILFVGSIFNRRRVPDLIRAFAQLAPDVREARLEIVGDNRTHPREDLEELVRALGVAGRVGLRSYVSEQELAALYASARVFAFLSEYEGFGLTPLEALAHAVPIVVLDTPVAREIYEDAAVYVQPGDIEGTSAALRSLLTDADARASRMRRVAPLLARYCWSEAAARTLAALERAGGARQ